MNQTREQAIRKIHFAEMEPMKILICPMCHVQWVCSVGAPPFDYESDGLSDCSVSYDVAECACGERFAVRSGTEFIFGIPKH